MTTFTSNSSLGLIIDSDTSGNINFVAGNTNVLSITSSGIVNVPSRFVVPVGNTASRPSATPGLIRFNNESGVFEASNGSVWLNVSTPPPVIVEYLVIAGGGSGGGGNRGGGGGAGGYRTSSIVLEILQDYIVTIGAGGASRGIGQQGLSGANSVFSSITSAGGGGGGGSGGGAGQNGGSGGGASSPGTTIGQGNTPSVSPSQGNNGDSTFTPSGGGGGGARLAVPA